MATISTLSSMDPPPKPAPPSSSQDDVFSTTISSSEAEIEKTPQHSSMAPPPNPNKIKKGKKFDVCWEKIGKKRE